MPYPVSPMKTRLIFDIGTINKAGECGLILLLTEGGVGRTLYQTADTVA
jgi:hypothetical protein